MKSTQSFTQSLKWARGIVLALAVLSIGTSLASAQAFQGKFTLPFEAHWGQATLPPGEYTFTLSGAAQPFANVITVRRGNKAVAMIMSLSWSGSNSAGPSRLKAFRTGAGTYRIHDLTLRSLGETLHFGVPKSERQFIARGPDNVQVPVIRGGK